MSPKINWISAPLSISDWFSENTGFYRTGSGRASDVSKTEVLQLFSALTYYLSVAQQNVCLSFQHVLSILSTYIQLFNKQEYCQVHMSHLVTVTRNFIFNNLH